MKVYGWTELNAISFEIECIEVHPDDLEENSDGSFFVYGMVGEWYKTFTEAKNRAIEQLQSLRNELNYAIGCLRGMKKKDVEK